MFAAPIVSPAGTSQERVRIIAETEATMKPKDIDLRECKVILASPDPWEECVVFVETSQELVFLLSDEDRTGACVVEFPGDDGETIVRRIPLEALRTLLDAAERKLVGPK
jgi:hypothetical protein